LEVKGSFDDCQAMVKQAFADKDLNELLFLTSANSINVARWLPQQFFYFFACKQWPDKSNPPVISVPSGNFGNICAGLLAMKSGLPVKHFIAACNTNDVVPRFLQTNRYEAQKTIPTISNAMDVGDPSNFIRILQLFDKNTEALREAVSAYSITDDETRHTIKEVETRYNYLLDPHGAVGYLALQKYLAAHPGDLGFFAETAHPVKFYDVVEHVIGRSVGLPELIKTIISKEKKATLLENGFSHLKDYLISAV
jgi:threonine synthase